MHILNLVLYIGFPLAPSLPPQSLLVSVISSTLISVSWRSPPAGSHNGIIREYTVIIHHILSGMDQSFTTINNMLNVSTLSPFTNYSVKVAAVTVVAGPFTTALNITTFEDGKKYVLEF